MNRLIFQAIAVCALGIAMAGPAYALPFTIGNVFVSTGVGTVLEYTPTGTLVQTLTGGSGFMTGSAFDTAGNFYVTGFSNNNVRQYDATGASPGVTFGGGYSTPESIVFDASGSAYVGSIGGGIRQFDAAGNFLDEDLGGTRIDFMDLAADQSTMLYTQEGGEVHAVNVATGVALADFSTDVEQAFALRILSNGNVLVADGADIELLDATGTQIDSYGSTLGSTWFALNIDVSGTSFWSATTTGLVAQFDIATGNVLNSWNVTGTNGTWGLAVYGEVTQGGGGGGINVPEPSTLLLMGGSLLGIGFARRRRERRVVARVA